MRVALIALTLTCAACTSSGTKAAPTPSQPPVSAFAPGPCSTMATAVLDVGKQARSLGKGPTPPEDVRDRLKTAQATLRGIEPGLTPDLAGPVDKLVVAIGLVRIRADGNTYTSDLGTSLVTAYDAVVDLCT